MKHRSTKTLITLLSAAFLVAGMGFGVAAGAPIELKTDGSGQTTIYDYNTTPSTTYTFDPDADLRFKDASTILNGITTSGASSSNADFYYAYLFHNHMEHIRNDRKKQTYLGNGRVWYGEIEAC